MGGLIDIEQKGCESIIHDHDRDLWVTMVGWLDHCCCCCCCCCYYYYHFHYHDNIWLQWWSAHVWNSQWKSWWTFILNILEKHYFVMIEPQCPCYNLFITHKLSIAKSGKFLCEISLVLHYSCWASQNVFCGISYLCVEAPPSSLWHHFVRNQMMTLLQWCQLVI